MTGVVNVNLWQPKPMLQSLRNFLNTQKTTVVLAITYATVIKEFSGYIKEFSQYLEDFGCMCNNLCYSH